MHAPRPSDEYECGWKQGGQWIAECNGRGILTAGHSTRRSRYRSAATRPGFPVGSLRETWTGPGRAATEPSKEEWPATLTRLTKW